MPPSFLDSSRLIGYPFKSRIDHFRFDLSRTLYRHYSHMVPKSANKARKSNIRLTQICDGGGPEQDSIVLISTIYNAGHEILQFLHHYRSLGVSRFAFVDDGSTDDTLEILRRQPGVDVFASNVPFGDGNDRIWRQLLLERYGLQRWYLSVDSDEYLIFHDCENRALHELIAVLENRGEQHLLAIMLDIYPDGPLKTASPLTDGSTMPWFSCPMVDRAGYYIRAQSRGISIRGGPRYRMFSFDGRQSKYPLFWADESTVVDISHHLMYPYHRNFVPVRAALLHNKFGHGSRERVSHFAHRKRHNNSAIYEKMNREYNLNASLVGNESFRFETSNQLVDLKLIEPLI